MMIIPMIGKIYQPGKDAQGHFIDTTGVKDNRVMVMGAFDYLKKIMDEFYCVLSDMNEVNDCFDEVPRATPIEDTAPSM